MTLKFKFILFFLVGVFVFLGAADVSFADQDCYWGCGGSESLRCQGPEDDKGERTDCDWVCDTSSTLICVDPENSSAICNLDWGCPNPKYNCPTRDKNGEGSDCGWTCQGSGSACDNGGGGDGGGGPPPPPPPPPPSVDINSSPSTVNWNQSSTLSWSSSNASSCNASGDWSGSKPTGGSESTGNLTQVRTYNYNLACTGDGGSGSDSVAVNVNPTTPAVSNVSVTEPNYCASGPAATTEWNFSDPSGASQSSYQVQIDDQGSFSSPEWDSGKVVCSGCRANATPQGYLAFNTTYKARTRVWNQYDAVSDWTNMSSCSGQGCGGGGNQWKTPIHAYPQTDFTFAGAIPGQQNLIPDSPIQFTDQSTCYNNSGNPIICDSWLWDFDDGGSSIQRNPQHTYSQTGTYNVNLRATDNDSNFCSITKPVQIIEFNPIWKEVNPGG